MDNSSSLWSFGSISESPALNFITSSSEEMNQLKVFVPSFDDPIDHACGTEFFGIRELSLLVVFVVLNHLALEVSGVRDHWTSSVLLDVFLDLWKPSILLFNVLLHTNVHQEDNWLGGQEEMLVQKVDFLWSPILVFDMLTIGEKSLALLKKLHLCLVIFLFKSLGSLKPCFNNPKFLFNLLQIFGA